MGESGRALAGGPIHGVTLPAVATALDAAAAHPVGCIRTKF